MGAPEETVETRAASSSRPSVEHTEAGLAGIV
jgi:hypothetical protein